MRPIVHGLEAEYWGEVDFVYLDRESSANSGVVEQFGIFGQPVFILIAPDGAEIQRWYGGVSAATLADAIDSYLAG
jgi:thioredoxin-like negative regulator of GroEL